MEKSPTFLEGEKVIIEIKPSSFIAYFLSRPSTFTLLIIFSLFLISYLGFLLWYHFRAGSTLTPSLTEILRAGFLFLFPPIVPFLLWMVIYRLKYRWEYYWITNLRIIQRKGLIGYHFYSAPYERVSDVILSRNWIERIIGVGSVRVQTLAGSFSFRGPFGAELRMIALANPEEVQRIVVQFLRRKLARHNL